MAGHVRIAALRELLVGSRRGRSTACELFGHDSNDAQTHTTKRVTWRDYGEEESVQASAWEGEQVSVVCFVPDVAGNILSWVWLEVVGPDPCTQLLIGLPDITNTSMRITS